MTLEVVPTVMSAPGKLTVVMSVKPFDRHGLTDCGPRDAFDSTSNNPGRHSCRDAEK
ncbi:hypothetical protein PC116_g15991 [Phytophthora cactorum]|uniref:Uncharacterized protein n=1 Tax=Phytophthora cactorum TaxID=29920 RepID=A0A8T0ZWR7_9STRA|nr:hypothetical protein PC111_g1617 [Phytophthora cactorum]KAG2867025.1 hypothetical protein PC113_g2312 [Phytophthora cactorum]KAG2930501.1 hypothetical protein PC114_g2454 [Phytophthora cactorum]KAG2943409.1 hypothetical protein PC115_g816 [Phytophthora cactorum]KAG2998072.1 hypothetical protein PC118_g1518 [Phytophthora cactorum]